MGEQVKIGDELAIGNRWYPYRIYLVTKISPKGFITMSNGDVLTPDLHIRGHRKWGISLRPDRFEPATSLVRELIERHAMTEKVDAYRSWCVLTTDQLRRIVAILDEVQE